MDYAYDFIRNSKCLIAVYVNFSEAFNTVNHKIMLKKLCILDILYLMLPGQYLLGNLGKY